MCIRELTRILYGETILLQSTPSGKTKTRKDGTKLPMKRLDERKMNAIRGNLINKINNQFLI